MATTGRGMLLERLFVEIGTEYDERGLKEAEEDIDKVDDGVKKLNRTLNVLTAALGAAALAGLNAFTGWDRVLTEVSGKAGLTRREFDRLYGSATSAISRATGAEKAIVASTFQQSHSLGVTGSQAEELVSMAAVLQSAGIADARQVIENSIRIANQGFGTPKEVMEAITKGAQVGAGDMATYYRASGRVMQFSSAFGIDLSEMVGALTVLSQAAPTMREGATQLEGFLSALNNPTKDTTEGLAALGTTPDEMKAMIREEGLGAAFQFLSQFSQEQLNALAPGNKEAAKFITAMAQNLEAMQANTKAIENSEGTIDGIEQDNRGAWHSILDRFTATMKVFMERYGAPFAKMLGPLVTGVTALLNGIIALDEATSGLVMWIPALVTSILMLRLATLAATKAFAFAKGLGAALGGGGFLGGVAGRDAAKKAAAKGGAGFWKGLASALGLTQLTAAVKDSGFLSALKRVGALFVRLAGPLGAVVAVVGGITAAIKGIRDVNAGKEATEARISQVEEFNKQMAYFSLAWDDFWKRKVEAIRELTDFMRADREKVREQLIEAYGEEGAWAYAKRTGMNMEGWDAPSKEAEISAEMGVVDSLIGGLASVVGGAAKVLDSLKGDDAQTSADLKIAREQARGAQLTYDASTGALLLDGRPLATTDLNGNAAGAMRGQSIVNHTNITGNAVNVDARGATKEDADAIGEGVAEAWMQQLSPDSQPERVNYNAETFQIGG